MITALSGIVEEWFTPESEKDEDKPTRFKIKPMTPSQRESVMEMMGEDIGIPVKNYGQVLKMSIVEWENFNDERGAAVKCSWTNHDKIPMATRMEIASHAIISSMVSEEQEKN